MNKIGFIATLAASALSMGSSVVGAAADDIFTRQDVVDYVWTEVWEDSAVGEENPRASLEYKQLQEWLDKYYAHSRFDFAEEERDYIPGNWSEGSYIRKAWLAYRDKVNESWAWDYDDETGEFTLVDYDPETEKWGSDPIYSFDIVDGMWNMIDVNGNTVDTFEPHGGNGPREGLTWEEADEFLKEMVNGEYEEGTEGGDTDEIEDGVPVDDPELSTQRVTGGAIARPETAVQETSPATAKAVSETESSSDNSSEKSSALPMAIGGGIALAAVGVYAAVKKKGGK